MPSNLINGVTNIPGLIPTPVRGLVLNSTLSASGVVSFDLNYFYFNDVNFRYPQTTIADSKKIYRTKLFEHGVQGGFGYGLINGKFDFWIGYGGQINFDSIGIFQ